MLADLRRRFARLATSPCSSGALKPRRHDAGCTVKTKTIPALEARTQLGRIMREVQRGQLRVLVEKSGVPMVGIISANEFQRVIAERETRFEVVDRIRRRLPSVPDAAIQQDVREALKEVRRRRRA